jgi:hypothetical protein
MDQMMNYAANYGFPMMVAGFLLVRIETRLTELAASINDLTKVITAKL